MGTEAHLKTAQTKRRGVLLVNLGTPDAPDTAAVRRFLREFLMDARVLDMPAIPRWFLVNTVIAPFRAPKSAAAYQSIWTAEGSPLMVHSVALADRLRERTGLPVALGMRYGRPSIAGALESLGDVDEILVLPLYPQYASSSSGTALEAVYAALGTRLNVPAISVLPPFFDDPGWLGAVASVARPYVDGVDHVLFSFHSLPERQVVASDPGCALNDACCARVPPFCYRAQCLATARALADRLSPAAWSVSFQSRLTREPWLRPATDTVLVELAKQGVRRLAVLCPAFVADCLETVEEIGIRGVELFRGAGGEELRRVPCVNADPAWVDALARLVSGA